MLHRNATVAATILMISISAVGAQAPAPSIAAQPEMGPRVGEAAPNFTLAGATKNGVTNAPVTLSKFRGQTVVIAFFPKARTNGCTAQMTNFRDQYATLFNGGQGVQVIAISTDPDTALASWAKEANFPVLFASDIKGDVGKLYSAYREKQKVDDRLLFVVGPDGKITYTAKPFKAFVAESYAELGAAVKRTAGNK